MHREVLRLDFNRPDPESSGGIRKANRKGHKVFIVNTASLIERRKRNILKRQ